MKRSMLFKGVGGSAVAVLALVLAVDPVRGDIPPPSKVEAAPAAAPQARLVVQRSPTDEFSRIVIPRKLLPAAAVTTSAGTDDATADLRRRSVTSGVVLSTVLAGGFLAVVFVRRRKPGWAVGAAAALVVAGLLAGTAAADLLPPTPRPVDPPAPTVRNVPQQVVVETTETGNAVILILGKDVLPDAKGLAAPVASRR